MTNPIQYISRTFRTILNDINSDPDLVDKPNWFKRIWAGVGDLLSMYINATANNSLLRTAFTRQAVIDLCEQIDYYLSPQSTSSGTLIFHIRESAIFPFTVLKADIAAQSIGNISISSKRFEARNDYNVTSISETFTANDTTDQLTVARDYTTGERIRFTTTGTLPAPLTTGINYYAIRIDATHIKVALTFNDALAGTAIDITTTGSGTHTVYLYSFQSIAYQQTSLTTPLVIGTSDGLTEWQEFDIGYSLVLEDTLIVTINSVTWTKVDTFVDSVSTDTHYKLLYKSDGSSYIRFGNGVYGAIPGNFDIEVLFSYGGGADSNVSNLNKITIYAGSDSNIDSVSNITTFTGGANEESIENAKRVAPLLLKARNRFVTTEDGKSLSEGFTGVATAKVNKNVYGILSAQVLIVPNGGGLPSSALKSSLQSFLIERTVLEEVDVRVEDPVYITANVTSAAKMQSGYAFVDVLPFYKLCVRLLFSEYTKEIIDDYFSNGIESAVNLINIKWSDSFGSDDYVQIQVMLEELYLRELIPDFEQQYKESETLGFINMFVNGIDYLTWTAPAFPITLGSDEMSTDGAMILTEIP
jgi:hypothetical protein